MKKNVQRFIWIMLIGLLAGTARADVYVIVNVANSASALSPEQIERLFLLKSKRFESGEAAEPVNQTEQAAVRERFNDKVLGRTEAQLKYYWSRKMFAGGDKPPPVVGADSEVESFVATNKGGIGYLGVAPKGDNVKVVLRLKD